MDVIDEGGTQVTYSDVYQRIPGGTEMMGCKREYLAIDLKRLEWLNFTASSLQDVTSSKLMTCICNVLPQDEITRKGLDVVLWDFGIYLQKEKKAGASLLRIQERLGVPLKHVYSFCVVAVLLEDIEQSEAYKNIQRMQRDFNLHELPVLRAFHTFPSFPLIPLRPTRPMLQVLDVMLEGQNKGLQIKQMLTDLMCGAKQGKIDVPKIRRELDVYVRRWEVATQNGKALEEMYKTLQDIAKDSQKGVLDMPKVESVYLNLMLLPQETTKKQS